MPAKMISSRAPNEQVCRHLRLFEVRKPLFVVPWSDITIKILAARASRRLSQGVDEQQIR